MRLLEPFAGYYMMRGHMVIHLVMFVASFMVDWRSLEDNPEADTLLFTFKFIRWSHFADLCILFFNYLRGLALKYYFLESEMYEKRAS